MTGAKIPCTPGNVSLLPTRTFLTQGVLSPPLLAERFHRSLQFLIGAVQSTTETQPALNLRRMGSVEIGIPQHLLSGWFYL